jgi:hypothetical protein
LSQKRQFFAKFFGENIFKNYNIGPRNGLKINPMPWRRCGSVAAHPPSDQQIIGSNPARV